MTDLRGERTQMYKAVGLLWIIGFFGLLAAAGGQPSSLQAATSQFDGTHAFVSQTNLNETFFAVQTEHIRRCLPPPFKTEPLTITSGQARYTSPRGLQFEGTVGSQGELTMRVPPSPATRGAGASARY
jgi:hypothetical protein